MLSISFRETKLYNQCTVNCIYNIRGGDELWMINVVFPIILSVFLLFFFASNYFWLLRTSDDVLSLEDYKQLLQFVYSSQRPLAATAGELLFTRYVDLHHLKKTNKHYPKKNLKTNETNS